MSTWNQLEAEAWLDAQGYEADEALAELMAIEKAASPERSWKEIYDEITGDDAE